MKTFKDFYEIEKAKPTPPTPAQVWMKKMATLTCSSEQTVKTWLCGSRVPDALARKVLSDYLGTPENELFPDIND